MVKVCKQCKISKALNGFHKHSKMKDGYINKCKECISKCRRAQYIRNRQNGLMSESYWKRYKLDMTPDKYWEMFKTQNGRCAICGTTNTGKKILAVDHDHKTGKIRGLLCGKCNGFILPALEKYSLCLDKAKEYLSKF